MFDVPPTEVTPLHMSHREKSHRHQRCEVIFQICRVVKAHLVVGLRLRSAKRVSIASLVRPSVCAMRRGVRPSPDNRSNSLSSSGVQNRRRGRLRSRMHRQLHCSNLLHTKSLRKMFT